MDQFKFKSAVQLFSSVSVHITVDSVSVYSTVGSVEVSVYITVGSVLVTVYVRARSVVSFSLQFQFTVQFVQY